MLFKWFDAQEASQFGTSLAEFFAQRIPPETAPATDKKHLKKVAEVIVKLRGQTQSFRKTHKLNPYKRAKLANAFQWKLFDLGYDKATVEELTTELLQDL